MPNSLSVRLYELGFSDRVIAQELAVFFANRNVPNNYMLIERIRENEENLKQTLAPYPSYFSEILGKYLE